MNRIVNFLDDVLYCLLSMAGECWILLRDEYNKEAWRNKMKAILTLGIVLGLLMTSVNKE